MITFDRHKGVRERHTARRDYSHLSHSIRWCVMSGSY